MLSATGKALFAMVASVPFLLGVPRMVTDVLLVFNLGAQAIRVALWTYWAMFGVAMAGFVFGFAFMAFAKFRAIRTVKQDIITRGVTYAHLADALGLLLSDRDILWCLEREPLPLRQ